MGPLLHSRSSFCFVYNKADKPRILLAWLNMMIFILELMLPRPARNSQRRRSERRCEAPGRRYRSLRENASASRSYPRTDLLRQAAHIAVFLSLELYSDKSLKSSTFSSLLSPSDDTSMMLSSLHLPPLNLPAHTTIFPVSWNPAVFLFVCTAVRCSASCETLDVH